MPDKIHLTVATVVKRDNLFLMVKETEFGRSVINQPAGHVEPGEDIIDAAIRETYEETGSKAEIIMPYTMFSLPHINQVHMFYLANLLDDNFGPTVESSEVKLFKNNEILWDEIAFPTVEKTLKYYLEDLEKDNFIFREEDIKLW